MKNIQKFYSGKTVLITGATGFLGKALLEKLLRSTEVDRIYVLIREKSGRTIHQRLRDLLKQRVFENLTSKSDPGVEQLLARVIAVRGDCKLPELGLSVSDRELLLQNVNVVFHCAATVRFTEPLRVAARINVTATKDLLEVAHQMKHLEAFVHVSTAFVGCTQSYIDEGIIVLPKAEIGGGSAVDALRKILLMDDQELTTLTPRILGKYPNTYTFTKTLAEEVLVSEVGDLPLAIFRPGIVGSAYAEPQPGWVENAFGIPSVTMGVVLGLIHAFKCAETATIAGVPVDYCVNGIIACGYRTAHEKRKVGDTPIIYNCVAEESNPIKWREELKTFVDLARKKPTSKILWYPFLFFTESDFVLRLLQFLFHTMPAIIYDLLISFKTKQKKSLPMVKRMHKLMKVAEYFLMRSWNISTGNFRNLWSSLDEADQQIFPFDMRQIDWKQHNYNSVMGVRRQLLNEDLATVDTGRKRYQVLRIVHYFTVFIVMCFLLMTILWLISLVVNFLDGTLF